MGAGTRSSTPQEERASTLRLLEACRDQTSADLHHQLSSLTPSGQPPLMPEAGACLSLRQPQPLRGASHGTPVQHVQLAQRPLREGAQLPHLNRGRQRQLQGKGVGWGTYGRMVRAACIIGC